MYRLFLKRILDFMFAIFILVVLAPVILTVLVVLSIHHKGKPFFVQARPGKNERIFHLIKFKTMTDARDEQGMPLPDKERLTNIGKFIRKTSLDELPQILNVLKGDMSFIGPRPLLPKYLNFYTENEKKRHCVLPGITGLAQVSGRNNINWDDKLAFDVNYVDQLSLKLDIKIFFKTIKNVLSSRDVIVDAGTVISDLDAYRSKAKA
ncbi:sugar transferase [Maribacter sp. MJ134]|uniref:sugar transferase n=1 Tax=Maribacter sp. MJ134 TaxID=2496865 RepID=UPI000F835D3C|nr:sugar transferase [Maribacter sp. MJ134]AZQ58480.1 sugar transferase [Maribacter sp. MJ134]